MEKRSYICGVVEGFYGRPWTTEQRKHLFTMLREFGMNTYLYAPKDDLKHRAEWRILYTAEEAALLESLISTARENGITFVYALSPGIDVIYSNKKEVKAVQDKFEQVRSLGCNAFSLLFDDIETKMNESDRKQFSSFALAQLTLANSIYEFLDYPLFIFCPTEYCESCSIPNLNESEYLAMLGAKLHPDIHILWTGPRVVSRLLTVEHLHRVSNILRRKPMIWDNLHANDYDPKRIFMGPFLGRPVAIKNETSGLLLNPNCKFEANYIPLYTLSDWLQADMDAPKIEEDQNALLESTATEEAVKMVERGSSLYHPLTSLRRALDNWLPLFNQGPGPAIPPLSQLETQAIVPVIEPNAVSSAEVPPPTIRTCEGNEVLADLPPPIYTSPMGHATTVTVQAFPLTEAIIGVVEAHDSTLISKAPQTVNSLTTVYNEPMDSQSKVDISEGSGKSDGNGVTPMDLETEHGIVKGRSEGTSQSATHALINNIDMESLALFVDIFYLPFEHGQRGKNLLNEIKWLFENAQILRNDDKNGKESEEWFRRFSGFENANQQLNGLYRNIIKSPNKSLLQEIFPYLWEAQGLVSVLCALLAWMKAANLLFTNIESINWCMDDIDLDSEPWALGGGLLPDLQKLIITSPRLGELFTIKFAIPLSLRCYEIRPVKLADLDKVLLFNLFASPNERHLAECITGTKFTNTFELSSGHTPEKFFFDGTFAVYQKYGIPAHHFIVESASDEDTEAAENIGMASSPCSLALGILNFAGILDDFRDNFLPRFRLKYARREQSEQRMEEDSPEQQQNFLLSDEIDRRVSAPLNFNQEFLANYQSMVEIRWPAGDAGKEAVSVRRLLHCISASLALNGSTGFFTLVNSELEDRIDLLTRLGLHVIDPASDAFSSSYTIMGHSL